MIRWGGFVAALVLLAAAGCGGGNQDPSPSQGAWATSRGAGLPGGCHPAEVRGLTTGFARAISAGDRAAVSRYLEPSPDLARFTVYLDGTRARSRTGERHPAVVAARLVEGAHGERLSLSGAEVEWHGPADGRYRTPVESAGADVVFSGQGRTLVGRVGIDCDAGTLYVGGLSFGRPGRVARVCRKPVDPHPARPVVCVLPPGGLPTSDDSLLRGDRNTVVVDACERASREMDSAAVYCPGAIPRGRVVSRGLGPGGRSPVAAHGSSYELDFADPSHQPGSWFVSAAGPAGRRFRSLTAGPGTEIVDERLLSGVPVTVVERRLGYAGPSGRYVSAVWRHRGRAFEASVRGFGHRSTAIGMAQDLIAEIHACGEGRRLPGHPECALVFSSRQ